MEYTDLLEKNFYTLLGLDQNQLYDNNDRSIENEDEIDAKIEEAYNKKASEIAKDPKQSKLLRDAYNVLKDRKRRNEYNQLRKLIEKYNEEKKVKKEVAELQQRGITPDTNSSSEISRKEYEQKLKDYNKILSMMQESANKVGKDKEIEFIPIYKGRFGKRASKGSEKEEDYDR